MKVYAIVPARSGSKGFKNKNVQQINGSPLIAYSIRFAQALGCDRVICSTDSEVYRDIAEIHGAEVPFLRSDFAARDTAMEQDVLKDLYEKFIQYQIEVPDIIVWLRPTFVFRDLELIQQGIQTLIQHPEYSSVRTICETESRLYRLEDGKLIPTFDDQNKSMIRRQDVGSRYKVYSTDIFRFNKENLGDDFLGRNVLGLVTDKICGLDIDDESDFNIVKCLVESGLEDVKKYLF
ncbi:acylneuraminate cytidylyltransferase family protein [Sphingobacterium corticibacter]|uniref:Acylneuraminate cytidylyltransferase family protein n=1 Tax=Sphingobacterium corticibacter TaxID=2171749 RepID=A0A2T8HJJ2_9SPHI|nr:acylneuraminate cytidylyltransferase family protein [Sphingobacterium corticibacter]PVH25614.1 hypothetical protein DC487_06635 [Sphingobacterium corticibacter]